MSEEIKPYFWPQMAKEDQDFVIRLLKMIPDAKVRQEMIIKIIQLITQSVIIMNKDYEQD